ncbi:NUDIX domain-containing protein [Streptomyces clavifer]|uniref:NUDIX domain-containing protein n=1 Tax=Streptomyces clavifer TaxID=68188 RepID=UPI00364D0019
MSSRTELRSVLTSYLARHPAESAPLAPVRAALDAARQGPAPVTCSAVVIDRGGRVLHVPDSPTGSGLPGTRPQDGDRSPLATALRAVREQTGIPPPATSASPRSTSAPRSTSPRAPRRSVRRSPTSASPSTSPIPPAPKHPGAPPSSSGARRRLWTGRPSR